MAHDETADSQAWTAFPYKREGTANRLKEWTDTREHSVHMCMWRMPTSEDVVLSVSIRWSVPDSVCLKARMDRRM
jgi:hypothetical protein